MPLPCAAHVAVVCVPVPQGSLISLNCWNSVLSFSCPVESPWGCDGAGQCCGPGGDDPCPVLKSLGSAPRLAAHPSRRRPAPALPFSVLPTG